PTVVEPDLNPEDSEESVNTGTNHNVPYPFRARSIPLIVSLAPAQLTCTHGRKKHTSAMNAALVLMRRRILMILIGPLTYTQSYKRSIMVHVKNSSPNDCYVHS